MTILEGNDYKETDIQNHFYDSYDGQYYLGYVLESIRQAGGVLFPNAQSIITPIFEGKDRGEDILLMTTPNDVDVYLRAGAGYDEWEERYGADYDITAYPSVDDYNNNDVEGGILFSQAWEWDYTDYPAEADERRAMRACYEEFAENFTNAFNSIDWSVF